MAAMERQRAATVSKRPGAKNSPTDLADCLIGPYIASGLFMKKSSRGKWQKRLFQLRGPYLIYYDNPKKVQKGIPPDSKDSALPDAAFDLRNMAKCEYVDEDGGKIVLTSGSNKVIELKATSARDAALVPEWVEKINQQLTELGVEQVEIPATIEEEDEDDGDEDDDDNDGEAFGEVQSTFSSDQELADAAVKLQAIMRGKLDSQKVTAKKAEIQEQDNAASKLQAIMRGKQTRNAASAGGAAAAAPAAAPAAASAEPPVYQGWVEKQGHSTFGMSYQKRLFVLQEAGAAWEIAYYKGEKSEANKKGSIPMTGATVTPIDETSFVVDTPNKIFPCRVDTPAECNQWQEKIAEAIRRSSA